MQAPAPSEGGGIAGEHRRRVPPLWRSGVGPPYARGGGSRASRGYLAELTKQRALSVCADPDYDLKVGEAGRGAAPTLTLRGTVPDRLSVSLFDLPPRQDINQSAMNTKLRSLARPNWLASAWPR